MNRYLSSFIISILIYISLFAGAIVIFNEDDNFSDKDVDKPNVICVSMVAQKVTQKQPIKKIQKKKKTVKKVVKEKELPKPKKTIPKTEIVKKELKKEEVVEDETSVQEYVEVEKKQEVIATKKCTTNTDEIKAKQNIFFTKLRNRINENKSYPRSARRRGIEGSVEVKFNLCSDGNVKDIKFISGKNVFKKSIIEAIEDSFPIDVDKSLFSFPKEFKISVEYILS